MTEHAEGIDLRLAEAVNSEVYAQVRTRIFRQLLESFIFERIAPVESIQLREETLFILHGRDEAGMPVTYNCRGERRPTFGRVRLNASPLQRISREGKREAVCLRRFLREVAAGAGADPAKLGAFAEELERTLLHDAIAQYERLRAEQTMEGSYDELETAAMDGHPYHPSYKSRIGFSPEDQLAYGPEFGPLLRPVWIAVRRADAAFAIGDGESFEALWRSELGEERLAAFEATLAGKGLALADVALLPVHPWQWRNAVIPRMQEELRDGRIIPLGPGGDLYRPQQSIRTLHNASSPAKPSVKMAMTLLNTSAYRHIEPYYAKVAPAISEWLQRTVDRDPYLRDEAEVILLREFAGIGYEPKAAKDGGSSPSGRDAAAEGMLACIWRDSLAGYLRAGESGAPFHALSAFDPVAGRLFIAPWLERHGAERWLRALFERCVLPVAHLALAHGIGLESHAQNMALVHRDGWPSRVALKDFHEDAMFYRPLLSADDAPDFEAIHPAFGEGVWFEQREAAPIRYLLLGALYGINLGELAMVLADHGVLTEARFWTLAAETMDDHIRRHPELGPRLALLDPFAETTRLEQLTKKRLFRAEPGTLMHEVSNPLHAAVQAIRDGARAGVT
ncbi:IucA/IucC family protein [Paenibacillus methanolicus]|uniref:Siderophore synthetase component n=1 Tax=Paenibacillus methanolicus TaxID=582686 RepID=A0A5S5BWD4_9BACL|nr:IucA/IucC family protein [Paenibacillus methanolicus]TYP70616.1 siderophore synthetase component [Paenibacillus methanolicus]